jgi:hypothetical protein
LADPIEATYIVFMNRLEEEIEKARAAYFAAADEVLAKLGKGAADESDALLRLLLKKPKTADNQPETD